MWCHQYDALSVCSGLRSVYDNDKSITVFILTAKKSFTYFWMLNSLAEPDQFDWLHIGEQRLIFSDYLRRHSLSTISSCCSCCCAPPPPPPPPHLLIQKTQQKVWRGFTKDIKSHQPTCFSPWELCEGRGKDPQPIKPNVKTHLTPAIGFTLVWNDQAVLVTKSVKSSPDDDCSSSTYYRSSRHPHVWTDLPSGVRFSSIFQRDRRCLGFCFMAL